MEKLSQKPVDEDLNKSHGHRGSILEAFTKTPSYRKQGERKMRTTPRLKNQIKEFWDLRQLVQRGFRKTTLSFRSLTSDTSLNHPLMYNGTPTPRNPKIK